MRKLLCLILVMVICLSLCACGGESKKQLETDTLELLNSAFSMSKTGMSYMLRGWDFSIEHSTDSTREEYEALWAAYGAAMAMTEEDMVNALIEECGFTLEELSKYGADGKTHDVSRGLNTTVNGMLFMKANYAVYVARHSFRAKNGGADISGKLEQVKANLAQIGSESDAYEMLKEYYLMVSEMNSWIESPSGNYNSSSSALEEYEKNAEKYKLELELLIN